MKKPNLIFFLSDNHAREYLGAAGHPTVKTPTLDSIAARGVRFTDASCASPLCCPSRAALATGRFPHQTGYWDNAIVYDGQVPTWHHRVRDQGSDVAAIGKLHFRSADDDNGFSEEMLTMHIVEGKGSLISLLRATEEGVPQRKSHKAIYEESGPGEADYQIYDRQITDLAIEWLQNHGNQEKPWILLVSYPSPHPPFKVPQRFWDMYPVDEVPMPVQWRRDQQPKHPATEYLSWMNSFQDGVSEELVRRTIAGYCGLITHTDEQIGLVLNEAEQLGLMDNTRIIYTSDHGEAVGNHGIFGKANLYEHSLGVPLLMAGPGIPEGRVIEQAASHVDLFPTIVEAMGAELSEQDSDLPGVSLWPAINGEETAGTTFAEFHALGSRNSSFSLRDGRYKLIYHVDMPNQLFDLTADPREEHDLLANGSSHSAAVDLEQKLRVIVDPEKLDARSKSDQMAHMEKFGGIDEVRKAGVFAASPIPGKEAKIENV